MIDGKFTGFAWVVGRAMGPFELCRAGAGVGVA